VKWLFVLLVCTGIGVALYHFGAPYWLVYLARGLFRGLAYHH
jgi:hypothetical protein